MKSLNFFRQHWLIIAIIVLATWLRTWQLDSQAIFFGDAAHDLLVAEQAIKDRQLPLLGIESSVPRFRQGPLTVWLEMVIYVFAGHQLLVYSLVFAVISTLAVIAVYEYATLYVSRTVALLGSLLVATSPLAVAHGRVVYHITPIPLVLMFYLFALQRLWLKKPLGLFWAILGWCLVFQFELALLPTLVAIPYVLWRTRTSFSLSWLRQTIPALLIGLLPQIWYDLTHNFTQLGGFAVWVGYRVVSATGLVGPHALGPGRFMNTLASFWLYVGRVVSTDQELLKSVMFGLVILSLIICGYQLRKKTLPSAIEIVAVLTTLLTLGFMIHSAPSEAYFPPFIILVPLLVAYLVSRLKGRWQSIGIVGMVVISLINAQGILNHSFFVSNNRAFSYGASVTEQREIISLINTGTDGQFRFTTTHPDGRFSSYFDNLRWIAGEQGLSENADGQPVAIEKKDSALNTYPGMQKVVFPTYDLFHVPSL